MAFVGIDAVVYGAKDITQARRMFLDWGLKKRSDTRAGLVFATELGAEVVVRPDGAAGLRPPIAEHSQFREVIYGVSSRTHLAAIDRELSLDREVIRDKDGTLHSVDDSGVNIGLPGFDAQSWLGIAVPAGAPRPIVMRLNSAAVQALKAPEVRDRLESQGMEVVASSPGVYGEWLRTEIGKWRPIIEKLKIRVD